MKKRLTLMLLILFIAGSRAVWAGEAASLLINEFMASDGTTLADGEGVYDDWIEIANPTAADISLAGCYLTDDKDNLAKWVFPALAAAIVPANGYLVVFASGSDADAGAGADSLGYLHATFNLSADGEDLALVDSDGQTIVSSFLNYPEQQADIAYGRGSNGIDGYLLVPTPGAANGEATTDGWVKDTKFTVQRGFYTDPFNVEITCATEGATIIYTLDCSSPSETHGTVYNGPITISGTTVLRAMAYQSGLTSTDVDTQTYLFLADIIGQPATKPTSAWPDPTSTAVSTNQPPGGGGGGGGTTSKQAMDYGMDSRVTGDSRYASLMDDALLAVPSLSVVTDLDNLFGSNGIYANPDGDLECPACVEMILPDGSEGFHVNSGLRIRGGSSTAKSNPKHSFRIVMRAEYGDSKIEYPLFGGDGPGKFDKLDLRTAQNFSWSYTSPQYATWLDDPFSRDTMGDMGHLTTRGFFFHLYLDGVYWGLYQTEERPDAYYAQSWLGGDAEDYDAIKADEDTGVMYATDGTMDLYNQYWTQVSAGVSSASAYFKLQGKNADGTDNAAYPRYLDADDLIDYMLVVFFTGAEDMPLGPPNSNNMPRNLNIVANRAALDGFQYVPHDNEWSLLHQAGVSLNRVSVTLGSALGNQNYFNPWWLHKKLTANSEYVLRFADRVHKHFFNGGALTPEACSERYQKRIDEIDLAIIAESARWGDALSSADPRTRDDDWLPAVMWVRDSYFNATPQTRTAIVLGQLKSAGLYPLVDAPEFNQHGGNVSEGFALEVTAPVGTICLTTDGSDPRQIGGIVAASASSGSSGLTVALVHSATVKARALNGGVWSALTEADFIVNSDAAHWPLYE